MFETPLDTVLLRFDLKVGTPLNAVFSFGWDLGITVHSVTFSEYLHSAVIRSVVS